MEKLDYGKLQPLSANNTRNKANKAFDNEDCKQELEKYIKNLREYMLGLSVYDMASLLIAEQDWINRNYKRNSFSNSLIRSILKVDFGKTYVCENGFIHYALCIGESHDKYFVIPMTTSSDEIKLAYHPEYRGNGEKRLYLLKKADGNSKDAALYINDAKFISSGRIISVGTKITNKAYNDITQQLTEVALKNISARLIDLERENKALQEKNNMCEIFMKTLQK